MPLQIYTDGGSRGNPGPAAAAVVMKDEKGNIILAGGYFLGKETNNVAEYMGLVLALEAAAKHDTSQISLFMDSELIVKQITGDYRVKDPRLAELFAMVQKRLLKFDIWKIQHVRREQNKHADALVNKALDAGGDVVDIQIGNACPDDRPKPAPAATAGKNPVANNGRKAAQAASVPNETGEIFPVRVRCIADPRQDGCTSGMAKDREFLFTDATPGGMCIHATKAVLDTVLAMRYAASKGETLSPVRVRCRLTGCGAEFEVRMGT